MPKPAANEPVQQGTPDLLIGKIRLERKAWIDTEWRVTENSRRTKRCRLTAAGRRAPGQALAAWNRFVNAVGHVLATAS